MHAHQSLDAMKSATLTQFEHVAPDTPCTVRAVAADEAAAHLAAQHLVIEAAAAARPHQPRIEATPRDTERLAHQVHRPGPSVLRNKAELHIDSLAK